MAEECYEPEDAFSTTLVSDGKDEQTVIGSPMAPHGSTLTFRIGLAV